MISGELRLFATILPSGIFSISRELGTHDIVRFDMFCDELSRIGSRIFLRLE